MTGVVNGRDPDAFVLIHHPKDGGEPYGIGPFPPHGELADRLIREQQCDCAVTTLWVGFPKGIRMAVAVSVAEVFDLVPEPADGPVH